VNQAPSPYAEKAHALALSGRVQEAMRTLEAGVDAGEGDSLFSMAIVRVHGGPLPRDLKLAGELFGKAAEAGIGDAAHCHVAFVTHGAGETPNWARGLTLLAKLAEHDEAARRQYQLILAMDLSDDGDPRSLPEAEQLSDSPDVRIFRGLFTSDECEFLIERAIPHLEPAMVGERASALRHLVADRTCEGAGFPLMTEDPAIHALNRRLAAASKTTVQQGEPLQVLRYSLGQEYRPHYDLTTGSNPRVQTFLVYLNDDFDGGETAFVKTGLKFKGGTGDGILFRNAADDGTPDLNAEHAGLPVTAGTKVIASRWIRARPIDYLQPLD
jgi:prolyl 4-hydroxylase